MADCSGESWRIVFPDLRSVSRFLHPLCQLGRDRGRSTLREGSPWNNGNRGRVHKSEDCEKSIGREGNLPYVRLLGRFPRRISRHLWDSSLAKCLDPNSDAGGLLDQGSSGLNAVMALATSGLFSPRSFSITIPSQLRRNDIIPELRYSAGYARNRETTFRAGWLLLVICAMPGLIGL